MLPQPQLIPLVPIPLLVLVDEPSVLQHGCGRILTRVCQLGVSHEVVDVLLGTGQLELA